MLFALLEMANHQAGEFALRCLLHQIRGDNSGFVTDYEDSAGRPNAAQRAEVMKFFGAGELPVTHALADAFTVCDQWFSSVPGPTWTNRFFVHSGTSLGRVSMPRGPFNPNLHWYDQDTIFDRLNDRGISWNIYYGDWPQSLLLTHQLLIPSNAARYSHMDDFFEDAAGAESNFPFYSFIEPTYFGTEANDYHPGPTSDVFRGEALLGNVYNQIRQNQALWETSLLIVLFDEHGGLFDPVSPTRAKPPDHHKEEYTFDLYGVRVPALFISPWIDRGTISTLFDHTSILKYLCEGLNLKQLHNRELAANSFAENLDRDSPRTDTPASIPVPAMARSRLAASERDRRKLNDHQAALISFSEFVETKLDQPTRTGAVRRERMMAGTDEQEAVAKERLELFLRQQKTKAKGKPKVKAKVKAKPKSRGRKPRRRK